MDEVEKRLAIYKLGERAIIYYKDTGLCVFCNADDCAGVPHEDHCNVGQLSGIRLTAERVSAKARERAVVDQFLSLLYEEGSE